MEETVPLQVHDDVAEEIENTRVDIIREQTEHFGDQLRRINIESTLRIGFININGVPLTAGNPKNKIIHNTITNKQIGILGMTELNRCWHLLPDKDKWKSRTRGWWEASHCSLGYNRNDNVISTAFQPGGTAVISIDQTSHRIISSGVDSSGLGRWSWTRYRGKHEVTLRVISAYRPCKPSNPGPNTAYSQQQRYLDRHGDSRCPRDAMLSDLADGIDTWRAQGDQIILMADFNENVEGDRIKRWYEHLQLSNAISTLHSIENEATFHRGSLSIDAILVSHTINPTRAGYLPFGAFPSDHRCIWMDISMETAFGFNPPSSHKFQARRLKSDDPTVRKKWLQIYESHIKTHNLHHRQFSLESNIQQVLTPPQIQEYEDIRSQRMIGIKLADAGCRKLHMGNVPYSAKYKELTDRIELWKAVITKKNHCKFSQSKLRRLERTTGISNSLHCSLAEAKENEKQAYEAYWAFKKTAAQHRLTFLESKAKAISEETGHSSKNIIKQLITREKQREAARRVKATLNKIRKGGITMVEVAQESGEIVEITSKYGIEQACMHENKKKFLQTNQTPCMKAPLRQLLGKYGDTPFCDQILNGTYVPPPSTSQYTRELFDELKSAQPINDHIPSLYLSKLQFQDGWKKMNEHTSAGISGLHFGHMKTCATSEFASQFESSLSFIPFFTGYTPKDWSVGVNVMIQKKDKVNEVSKLRTITLTEADFNFNNKLLGKETLAHAEAQNFIAKEQYGSRKGKSAIEHAVHKRLTFDIMRQLRTNGALCSNDAKSCYDRILHSIASLAYQRLGVPLPPVKCMLRSIQNMKHHIRTSYGDSAFTMSNDGALVPFQGALQGNGASPATWVIISTPLLNMLRTAGNGGYFIEPISKQLSHSVGYAFVDDTDLIQFDARDQHMSEFEVLDKMQSAINRWEGGLKATGGAIVPQKSFVYPIIFEFDESGNWSYKKVQDIDHHFTVLDHDDTLQPLDQLDASIGKCTLGVYLAPDGNNVDAIKSLRTKSEEWSEYINSGHLNQQDAWLATETTILKSLLYPLAALTLTEKECDHIMAPVLASGLQNSSICKNFPRAVAYGPREEGGLQLPNLYVQQGLARIGIIVDHLGANNMMGELLRTSIETAKVEIGVGRDLFSLDYTLYNHLLTDSWIKSTWHFAHQHQIEVIDKVTKNLQLHRNNDVFLMEIIANHGFTKSEMKKINMCRLYLQVTTLSDITCGYGNKYTKAYNCLLDQSIPHHYLWPIQPKPSQSAIRIWRKALRLCFHRTEGIMDYYLGRWLYRPSTEWKWLFSVQTELLYQRYGQLWRIWRRRSRAGNLGHTPVFQYDTNGFYCPPHCVRATIVRRGQNCLIMTGWSYHDDMTPFSFQPSSNTDWLLDHSSNPNNVDSIKNSIESGTAIAVSDGSFLDSSSAGTAGWIIEDSAQLQQLQGTTISPGPSEVQCSHRSELVGILGVISHVNKICSNFDINQGTITVGCDGIGALQSIDNQYDCKSSFKHFDLIRSIKSSIKDSTVKWKFQHIKGHQDDYTHYDNLNRPAQLNVLTDAMAKHRLQEILQEDNWNRRRPQNLPHEKVEVYWTNRHLARSKISSNLQKTLTKNIQTTRIRQYYIKKKKFSGHTESYIDWKASQKSRSGLPRQRQKWLSKWVTGFCGVGVMLRIYKYQNHSKCPRCLQDDETTTHVLRCSEPGARTLWNQALLNLEGWMTSNYGHPELIELIIIGLRKWYTQERIPYTYDILEPLLKTAWTKQRRIGWKSFIEGFWVKEWATCQTQYLRRIRSQRSSLLWISRVQRRIWMIAWNLWEHRNNFLHNDGRTIHQFEMTALDEEIQGEWTTGIDQLPPSYSYLFNGQLETRLEDNIHHKLMWIHSVWTARDNEIHIGPQRLRNSDIINLYERWKSKNDIND